MDTADLNLDEVDTRLSHFCTLLADYDRTFLPSEEKEIKQTLLALQASLAADQAEGSIKAILFRGKVLELADETLLHLSAYRPHKESKQVVHLRMRQHLRSLVADLLTKIRQLRQEEEERGR